MGYFPINSVLQNEYWSYTLISCLLFSLKVIEGHVPLKLCTGGGTAEVLGLFHSIDSYMSNDDGGEYCVSLSSVSVALINTLVLHGRMNVSLQYSSYWRIISSTITVRVNFLMYSSGIYIMLAVNNAVEMTHLWF